MCSQSQNSCNSAANSWNRVCWNALFLSSTWTLGTVCGNKSGKQRRKLLVFLDTKNKDTVRLFVPSSYPQVGYSSCSQYTSSHGHIFLWTSSVACIDFLSPLLQNMCMNMQHDCQFIAIPQGLWRMWSQTSKKVHNFHTFNVGQHLLELPFW